MGTGNTKENTKDITKQISQRPIHIQYCESLPIGVFEKLPLLACSCSNHSSVRLQVQVPAAIFSIQVPYSLFWPEEFYYRHQLTIYPKENSTTMLFLVCMNFFNLTCADDPLEDFILNTVNLRKIIPEKSRSKWEIEKCLDLTFPKDVVSIVKQYIEIDLSVELISGKFDVFIRNKEFDMQIMLSNRLI
jgi:hypothetical protein